MTKFKFSVLFAVIVCITGSFPNAAKSQSSLGIYCFSCAYNPMYPRLNKNNNASSEQSLFQQAFAEGEKGNYEAEVGIYAEIVRINPQSAYAYYDIGQVKKNKLNDRAGAIEAFRMAANIFRQQGNDSMFRDAMEKVEALGG
jgi:tetratricopeptide (TPR) repeat protein